MRFFYTILCFFVFSYSTAANYYFSASGNDAAAGTIGAPWQTIAKFNAIFASRLPGDNLLFNRGDVFVGTMNISRSGAVNNPITIGAYGTGADPIISGFTNNSAWTNLGSNIWESTGAISTKSTCNMVVINGINTAMGRTPNYPTYYVYNSRNGNTSITSTQTNVATTNWTGSELVFFTTTYRTNRHPIVSHVAFTLTYTSTGNTDFFQSPQAYFVQNFFLQNDVRTLDVQNEWFYNPSTKKLRIYSTTSPGTVKIASVDTLAWTGINHDYISFDHISFQGSNQSAIELGNGKYIKITNCTFNFLGKNAVYGANWGQLLPGLKVEGCTINNANNCGIDVSRWFYLDTIRNNTVHNIGMLVGMGYPTSANLTVTGTMSTGIKATGANSLIEYNVIDSTGYIGINYGNSNSKINNNYVRYFCKANGIKDGGGIYTVNNSDTVITGNKVHHNIVGNSGDFSQGIYGDDLVNGGEWYNNTTFSCERGMYIHNPHDMNVHDNTSYDCNYGFLMGSVDVAPANISLHNNILVAKDPNQYTVSFLTNGNVVPAVAADNNYYARPIDDNLSIVTYQVSTNYVNRNLAGWQAFSGIDASSGKSPRPIPSTDSLLFIYNATSSAVVTPLSYNYEDMPANQYNGTITLQPFTSAVLIQNGPITGGGNTSPISDPGADQNIQLPTTSVTVDGSGSNDPDGTIVFYHWTQISGSAASITNPNSVSTTITGLTTGTYVFQLQVTDNLGATATNTITIGVSTTNTGPTANAGTNINLTLPTNTTTLDGTGSTDADGTIVSYQWTKVSGANVIFASPTSSTSGLTVSSPGTYVIRLTVTDNNGATSTDDVNVIVAPDSTPSILDYIITKYDDIYINLP